MEKDKYPRPAYTADNVILLVPDDPTEEVEQILLIKRLNEPFKDCWALPGGYVNLGETSQDAARREAKEEIGMDLPGLPTLVGIFDAPDRDPRGWVVAAAYRWFLPNFLKNHFQAGDDAKEAKWFPVNALPEQIAFDHIQIIKKAIAWRI